MNDELLVKYLVGEATSFEIKAVESWIDASVENSRYFKHFKLILEKSKNLIVPSTVNPDEAWQRFQQRSEGSLKEFGFIRRLNPSFNWVRVAAILLISVGALAISYFLLDKTPNKITFSSSSTTRTDTLPDGSVVILNKNSSLGYTRKFKGAKRNVDLKGEAFFSVSPDKEKPFIINVNDITVTVVGTSFNVKCIGKTTQVIVETGVVKVARNNKIIELGPNEKLIVDPAGSMMEKERVTDKLHQYYRSKEFVCDNTPLWKLVEVLNEAYHANIIIERKELGSLPLTTTFYNESLENILTIISETFNITVERRSDRIILK